MRKKWWLSLAVAALLVMGVTGLTLAGCGSGAQAPTFITPVPILSSLSVNAGPPGTTVRLTGQGFGDGTNGSVTFAGTLAGVADWNDTYIDVVVPASCTSGAVIVTTLGGASNPLGFTIQSGST